MADTGPLVAAANRRDEAHELAAALVTALGRDLLVPSPVLAEADHLLPVLTFDFEDFRATRPAQGVWELMVDEARHREATS